MDEAADGGREGVCMATWSRSAPELLIIAGDGMVSRSVRVRRPPGGAPDHTTLHGTGWHAYPDAQWMADDLSPGMWECAVFADSG